MAPGKLEAAMQSNGVQFAPEQTLFIKAVPKGRVKFLEDAIISKCGAKAVNSVPDKDPFAIKTISSTRITLVLGLRKKDRTS